MRSSKYSREVLAPLVASSRSITEVIRKLGLARTGGNYRHISARIRLPQLDTSHFNYGRGASRIDVSVEVLAAVVRTSTTVAQVCQKLGLLDRGGPHRDVSARIRELGLDTNHFRGRGWCRGDTAATNASVARGAKQRSFTDEEVFIENSPIVTGSRLVRRLLAMGWQYRCTWCEISNWRGVPLVLHLDHINGISNDNRFINLRLLCPNCHSQTPTYCNRRR